MAYPIVALLTAFALAGHAALWATLINRMNAIPLHYLVIRWINRPALVLCGLIALAMIAWSARTALSGGDVQDIIRRYDTPDLTSQLARYYFIACWLMLACSATVWLYRRIHHDRWEQLKIVNAELVDVADVARKNLAGTVKARVCSLLPGNQIFHLETRTLELVLPKLPPQLEGISIIHLTDLHMAGHVGGEFYDEVVRRVNQLDGDLILITGDILDKSKCIAWLQPTLGQLRSRHGVYFVLGNHDYRCCPADELRAMLTELGLVDVGGAQQTLSIGGANVMLVGNELPWHKRPLDASQLRHAPDDPQTLSIALVHTPDRVGWASENGFDLMLAGHLHGGQIRLPVIGPILSPSRYGVRYASGTFFRAPTVLHVSRGLCGMMPLRFNCPPEISKFVLRRS